MGGLPSKRLAWSNPEIIEGITAAKAVTVSYQTNSLCKLSMRIESHKWQLSTLDTNRPVKRIAMKARSSAKLDAGDFRKSVGADSREVHFQR